MKALIVVVGAVARVSYAGVASLSRVLLWLELATWKSFAVVPGSAVAAVNVHAGH
jgi:hypothetical protein